MNASPPVEAVVVTHESSGRLPTCLAALAGEGVPCLVVDNASRDGSAELARQLGARLLRLPRNEGYGRANNLGARASGAEFLLIANPDITPDDGAVVALLAAAERYPEAGLWAPRIAEPNGRFFFQPRSLLSRTGSSDRSPPEGDCCCPFLSGACFLVRRELFLALGGFDERIFLFYEDDDLCRRLADRGFAPVHVHEAVVRHGRGRSTASAPGRIFTMRWHQAWSRAYVSWKYGLSNPAPRMFALNAAKALAACLTFRRATIERYAGSALGALAAMRGRSALAREGLEDRGLGDVKT